MPTYSYECGSCGQVYDIFHGIAATPTVKCESCGKKCRRLLGTGAGIIFKGSGFYETDFKDKKGKAPEKSSADGKSGAAAESNGGASEKKSAKSSEKSAGTRKKAAND